MQCEGEGVQECVSVRVVVACLVIRCCEPCCTSLYLRTSCEEAGLSNETLSRKNLIPPQKTNVHIFRGQPPASFRRVVSIFFEGDLFPESERLCPEEEVLLCGMQFHNKGHKQARHKPILGQIDPPTTTIPAYFDSEACDTAHFSVLRYTPPCRCRYAR